MLKTKHTKPFVVLCFGDSNTHGTPPMAHVGDLDRFPSDIRWPGVVQSKLGDQVQIIEEGHPGRTTVFDNPAASGNKSGLAALPIILESHRPLDCIIMMLGTNDLHAHLGTSAWLVANNMRQLIDVTQTSPCGPTKGATPIILLISPPHINEKGFAAEPLAGAEKKSRELARHFERLAQETGVEYLDAAKVIEPAVLDGIHLDEEAHAHLGRAVADKLLSIINTSVD
ncbi:SGNH/GDSL hydrolase family protein [Celeribacter sp.]|uniref:SGNH/GDSL hydrolase family protein n=1 Tax=Celeribacter sp. TaxID=1890673 RepID=UPI003A902EC1